MKNWSATHAKIMAILDAETMDTFKPMAQLALDSIKANTLEIGSAMGVEYIRINNGDYLSYAGYCGYYDPYDERWPKSKKLEKLIHELIRFYDEIGCDMKYSVELTVSKV